MDSGWSELVTQLNQDPMTQSNRCQRNIQLAGFPTRQASSAYGFGGFTRKYPNPRAKNR